MRMEDKSHLKGHNGMRKRFFLVSMSLLIPLIVLALNDARAARADESSLARTINVEMKYVRGDSDKNRLINARAAVNQMQAFFERVDFKRGVNYSFLRDVLRGSMNPSQGYV